MMISFVITTYNEGGDLIPTIESIHKNTSGDYEIIVIDDASTDKSCDNLNVNRVIKHKERIGIAFSRNEGADASKGDVVIFLDAHHRFTEGCANQCADLAIERQAIVWPCVRGLEDSNWTGHGATMTQKTGRKRGLFEGIWRTREPHAKISRSSTMCVPGYAIPKSVFPKVRLIDGMKLWGASEPAITVKAFFADVDILHLCGPMCRHGFRKGKHLPYSCPWSTCVKNHGLIARICFEEKTFEEYWWRFVLARWVNGLHDFFFSESANKQHKEFQAIKKRPDEEFWYGCMLAEPPAFLRKVKG